MPFKIQRVAFRDDGVFGVLLDGDLPFAVTLERPWLNNKKQISCIPTGEYEICLCSQSRDYGFKPSPKFGDTYQVLDVPDRSLILFHAGNTYLDTNGCILVAEQYHMFGDKPGVAQSRVGYEEFMKRAGGQRHKLVIR